MTRRMASCLELISAGDSILVRGGYAQRADASIANAVADEPGGRGDRIWCVPIDGLGDRDLQALANGPIMDPNRIYLPAGRCSEDEVRRREA